ncbi:probable E3 ubiquitin-protein ligase RHY1A [Typha latifolia]|uniref:probable E3 ubiquitin-protein ligase RHY1A n=1 Tax=Typha latifolia TaxID=4733 RepID=UPI003C2F6AB6
MTIASKLFYYNYQRSRTTRTSEPETGFDLNSPDRGRCGHPRVGRGGDFHHHDQSQRRELSDRHPHGKNPFRPISKKDHKLEFSLVDHGGTSKCETSDSNNFRTSNRKFVRSRLTKDAPDDQLPDAVKLARQRLLQRLHGVTQTGFRQTPNTAIFLDKSCSTTDLTLINSVDGNSSNLRELFESGSDTIQSLCDLRIKPSVFCQEAVAGVKQEVLENSTESDDGSLSIECCICLERLLDGNGLIQLKCRHTFHSDCLGRWVQSHGDCPYCRANVV